MGKGQENSETIPITLFESADGEVCIGLPEPCNLVRLDPDEADRMADKLKEMAAAARARAPRLLS